MKITLIKKIEAGDKSITREISVEIGDDEMASPELSEKLWRTLQAEPPKLNPPIE